MPDKTIKNTAILVYDNVEVLDFTGPYEVFTNANAASDPPLFDVYLVSESGNAVTAIGGLKVIANYSIKNCPIPDILLVPGGAGRKLVMNNPVIINWIKEQFPRLELLLSVCTGAFIIAKTGLLRGLKAATHHNSHAKFEKSFVDIELVKGVKYIDNGKIIMSGGISAGINMSLYVLSRLFGKKLADEVSKVMEFDYETISTLNR